MMFGILLTCREYLESLARLRLGKRQDFLILLELVPAYRTSTVCSGALFTRVLVKSTVGGRALSLRNPRHNAARGNSVFPDTA